MNFVIGNVLPLLKLLYGSECGIIKDKNKSRIMPVKIKLRRKSLGLNQIDYKTNT